MKLQEGIELYVQRKQAAGLLFASEHIVYRQFLRTVGNLPLSQLNLDHVSRFLSDPHTTPGSFRTKRGLLRHFFSYWSAQGLMARLAMPASRPVPRSNYLPYIFTREELHRLLRSAPLIKSASNKISCETLRAMILTLYATGAMVAEVRKLGNEDVDLRNGFMRFQGRWCAASRSVPIGRDLIRVVQRFDNWKKRKVVQSDYFFPRIDGAEVSTHSLLVYFARIRQAAGIVGYRDGSQNPCLRDLRATFAVHQITSWIKKKQDLNVMLPALGAYMGNARLQSMERYLQLTPERFQSALNKLSPQKGRSLWRHDPARLEFLSNI